MGTKKSMIKHLKTNYITSSKKLHLNPARDISLVLSIRIRVFVPDLPYTAAWNDHTVPRAKGSILPHNILPIGSMAELFVALTWIWSILHSPDVVPNSS